MSGGGGSAVASAAKRRRLDEESELPAAAAAAAPASSSSSSAAPAPAAPPPCAGAPAAGACSSSSAASSAAARPHNPAWDGCRSVTAYRPLRKIDEGTYGVVFAAEELGTGDVVALKKVKIGAAAAAAEGFPITALRETNVLLALRHPNIIRVREMVVGGDL